MNKKEESFARYDYDSKRANLEKYGQDTPPEYALGDIDFPVAILGGELDLLSDQRDLDWSQK